jgi:tetratricopeptide (TPR) repeat protein
MSFRRYLPTAVLAVGLVATPAAAQWPPDSLTNLQVLPEDIETRELVGMMAGFARALGVRCQFCHVGEEGMPLSEFDFAADDKPTKEKARVMLRMVQHINNEHLAELDERSDPAVEVTCATCHHGVQQPRALQDLLLEAYDEGGFDGAKQRYEELKERYYGRYSYDFSDIVWPDVATRVKARGALADAVHMLEYNVEVFPQSVFAQRMYVPTDLLYTYSEQGPEAGTQRYHELKSRFHQRAFVEQMLNTVGYRLLRQQRHAEAIAALRLNSEQYPESANTYDSLGEGYMAAGETALAIESYERSLALDPENANARQKLEQLRAQGGSR